MSIMAPFKIAALVLLFAALAPLQWLALRFGWRLAGRIPVRFHRIAAAMIGLRVHETGAMASMRPLLIVANHTSWIDIVALGSRAPLSFVARADLAGWPAVGLLARLQRTLFVDRARRSATGEAVALIGGRLAGGDPIVLFAEGTTGEGNRLLPYRSALLAAAQAAGGDAPAFIQPAIVAYPRRNGLPMLRDERPGVAWYGAMDLWPHLRAALSGGTLECRIVWGEARPDPGDGDRKRLAAELAAWAAPVYAETIHPRA
jgi:1-acyl-sn-glycerol-3-phosphate acyltransferase